MVLAAAAGEMATRWCDKPSHYALRVQSIKIDAYFTLDYVVSTDFRFYEGCDAYDLEGRALESRDKDIYAMLKRYGLFPASAVVPCTFYHVNLLKQHFSAKTTTPGHSMEALKSAQFQDYARENLEKHPTTLNEVFILILSLLRLILFFYWLPRSFDHAYFEWFLADHMMRVAK
ncbi:hypothetical protein BC940DRAFT_333321 [Gongronella butleri]|nr:hypothetical protein BC940DRAFT_333321 [Gongronella butleri]